MDRAPLTFPRAMLLAVGFAVVAQAAAAQPSKAAAQKAAQERAAQIRELDAFVTKGVKDWNIPGLSVSIVKNDSVVFAKGYGVRTLGKDGAELGSISSVMLDGSEQYRFKRR